MENKSYSKKGIEVMQHPGFRLNLIALAILSGSAAQAQAQAQTQEQAQRQAQAQTPNTTAQAGSSDRQLPAVTVRGARDRIREGRADEGYVATKVKGVGILGERELQDTPYSITVISEELIENLNAKDMDQIFKMNPTTQETARISSDATDGAWVTIRGFQVTNAVVDGIPYPSRVGGVPLMQGIERVEIINGASAFMYGGGRVGGAVNYITKKPTLEDLRVVRVGSYGGRSYFGHVDLGGQFDENGVFGYRLNVVRQGGESSRKEKKTLDGVVLALDMKPNRDFTTGLRFSFKDTEYPGPNIFWEGNPPDRLPPDRSRAHVGRNLSHTPDWQTHRFTSRKIDHDLSWNINDVFSLRTNMFYEKISRSGGDARIRFVDGVVQHASWFGTRSTAENETVGLATYLDSRFKTAGVDHTLSVGYLASSERVRNSRGGEVLRTTEDMTLDEFRNFPNPMPGGWGSDVGPRTPNNRTQYTNVQIVDDIRFNDRWLALIGGNYATINTKSYRGSLGYDESKFTPTLALTYKPISNLSTYVSYLESLEQATVATSENYINKDQVFPPYLSKQVEIGAKYNLNDRAMLSAALFRIEKANAYDIELDQPPPNLIRTRDGLQVHQGLELGFTGRVTDNLTVIAGGTLMDLSVEKSTNGALDGKKPTGAAARLAKIYAEYRIPGVQGLSLSGGAFYTGKQYYDAGNRSIVPAFTLFDVGLRYATRLGNHPTTFNFTVQNITDRVYWSNTSALGNPRTFALTMRTMF